MPISHHADTRMAFTPRLTGKTVVMFVDFSFEDMEVMYPKIRLEEEGARVIVSGAHPAGMKYTGRVRSFPHLLSVAVAAKGRCSSASMSMLHYLPLVCAPVSPPPPWAGKYGYPIVSDATTSALPPVEDVAALVLPGGFAPDYMRRNADMLAYTCAMAAAGKPVT